MDLHECFVDFGPRLASSRLTCGGARVLKLRLPNFPLFVDLDLDSSRARGFGESYLKHARVLQLCYVVVRRFGLGPTVLGTFFNI